MDKDGMQNNLVSDDGVPSDTPWNGPNVGVTLPDNSNATYNAGLSPLFLTRAGVAFPLSETSGEKRIKSIILRSLDVYVWTSSSSTMLVMGSDLSLPSRGIAGYNRGLSLRCLVSTTNS